ncbi:SixA phosphatase family protein [Jiella marina]|uniref:SixA phosphatase family protein n=1 Tax=Jiella sp. LLJ827 TaxID=2917712 RepID=UPI0021013546|nr:histidine phosphatase family protein [Jiella sp. LLJ827]MCQ0989720.1 histidine phosphatase family protein [Jiella sp. LLJ827]
MSGSFSHTLFILRHAHSSWARPGERDHQRPLDERGEADAARLAEIFAAEDLTVDVVVTSTAVRAAKTLESLQPSLGKDLTVETSDDLYALGVEAYFAAARRQREAKRVLIVGHNPMIEDFTRSVTGSADEDAAAQIATGFPTCALAIVGLKSGFEELEPGSGHLERVIIP